MSEEKAYDTYEQWFKKASKKGKTKRRREPMVKMTKNQFREYRVAKKQNRNTKIKKPLSLNEKTISQLSPEDARILLKNLDKKYMGRLIKAKGKSYKELKKDGILR